jgi:ABC-type multidrug transport system permease subunit
VIISYLAVGLNMNEWYKILIAMLIGVLNYNAFTGFGYILGTLVPDRKLVAIMTPIVVVPMMLFGGYFVNQDNIPRWLVFLREITIFKYTFQAFMLNEFTDLELDCSKSTNPLEYCDPLGEFNSPQTLEMSLIATALIWVSTYLISFFILKSLYRSYD